MTAAVYAGDLTPEKLTVLVNDLRSTAPHAVLQRVDDIAFPGPSDAFEPAAWDEGRVFGLPLELRWVRRGDHFRVVLTTQNEENREGFQLIESLDQYHSEDHCYYLWGENDRRIGRSLDYHSVPGEGRAQVVTREFYDDASELRHWRYVRFKREDEE